MEIAEIQGPSDVAAESLVPVRVATLKASRAADLDMYFPLEEGRPPQLYRGKDYAVTRVDFERLEAKGIQRLYLPRSQYRRFLGHARERAGQIAADEEFATTERFQVLQTAFAAEVSNAFRRIDVSEAVKASSEMGTHLAQLLAANDFVPRQLFDVMQHDASLFAHIVGVSSYSVMLAQRLGYTEKSQLEEVAIGAMLHDVGKRHIPPQILRKPSRLTAAEFAVVKEHPKAGYCDLCTRRDVTFSQLMMVYQHHERMDGMGYPVRILGDEIHPWARICAVVDRFDAMTGERPYRPAASAQQAIEHLQQIAGSHLDQEMVKCWTATMSKP